MRKEEAAMSGLIRFPVKRSDGIIELLELESIYYLEADGGDTLVRTARRKRYRSVQELGDIERFLPSPPFIRCHRSFIVNLERVRSIVPRTHNDRDLKMDPPVNVRVPVSRDRYRAVLDLLHI